MNNKTLAQIIQNNIRIKNLKAESGSCDIVIYDNTDGANSIKDIALEIGAIYEIFITSAFIISSVPYGQQKITIKFTPIEVEPNDYEAYFPITCVNLSEMRVSTGFMYALNDNKLWNININIPYVKIYKIIKKAV